MRISDCSSDVCSSDLAAGRCRCDRRRNFGRGNFGFHRTGGNAQQHQAAGQGGKGGNLWAAHDALFKGHGRMLGKNDEFPKAKNRSEEHTSELQSLMRISYAVFCLKTKISTTHTKEPNNL